MSTLSAAQKAYKKGKRARENARRKKVVTSERPRARRNTPSKPSPKQSQTKAPSRPQPSKPSYQPKVAKPKTPSTDVSKQYADFKRSSFAPKVTNTSDKSIRDSSLEAYNAYKRNRGSNVVGTEKPQNTPDNISDSFKVSKKDLDKAYNKGKNKTYLGTDQEDVKIDLATKKEKAKEKKEQKNAYYKSKDWKATKDELKKQNRKGWRKYLKDEFGWSKEQIDEWMQSDEGKKYRKETYSETKESLKKDINKEISKNVEKSNTLNSVNALTKGEFDKMVTATRLGKDLGNKYLDSVDKKLGKKIGSKTVEAGLRSKGAYGVMQGMSKADIFSGSVGKYDAGARTGMQQIKDSGAYNVGYGVGMAADMLMGGVASRGVSLAEGAGKVGAKLLGKEIAPKVAVEAAEEYAKFTGKEGLKRFAKNRAGELLAETPTNVLDAAKMSLDADGNLDKDAFKKWLGINSALTFGVGGAIEGIGAAATKELGKDTMSLLAKSQAGTLTEQEGKTLQKNIEKLKGKVGNNALSGNVASNISNNIDTSIKDARLQRKLEKANARSVNAPAELEKANAQNAPAEVGLEVPETEQFIPKTKYQADYVKGVEKGNKEALRFADKLSSDGKKALNIILKDKNASYMNKPSVSNRSIADIMGDLSQEDAHNINEYLELHHHPDARQNGIDYLFAERSRKALSDIKKGKAPSIKKANISPEVKAKVDNLQRNVDKVDKRIAELETKKETAKTPEMMAQIDAEISIANSQKREIVQNQKDLINPPKEVKPKPGYREHRIGVETRKLFRQSIKGEGTKEEIEKGITEIAEDLRKGADVESVKAKAYDLVDRTMKIFKEIEHTSDELSLVEEHREIKKLLRETKINISQYSHLGTIKQILEALNITNPGRRVRLVKSGGESIDRVYSHALELQAKGGAAGDSYSPNTLIKEVDTQEEMLQELCRLANEDSNHYKPVMIQQLSDDEIIQQYDDFVREILNSARKINEARPQPKSALEKAEEELRLAQKEYAEQDVRGAAAYSNLQNAKQTGQYVDEFQELYNKAQRQKFHVASQINELEKKVRELRNAKADKEMKELIAKNKEKANTIDDSIVKTGNKKADEQMESVFKDSEEGFDTKDIPKGKVDEDGILRATTEHNKNLIYHRVREAVVDNFDALEFIANHLPQKARDGMLSQINELRRSQKTGRAIVAEKGRKIYADAGLTKRGKEIELKRNEFEEYCFLLHALDRKAAETDFVDMSRKEIRDRLEELENKYALKDKDGVILEENNPIKKFQEEMVAYFDDLLEREVDAGITSAKEAANFRRMYPNYVPTYRVKEFDEILKRRTRDEIDVGKGLKAAKGGSDDPLVPLYNQMQVKTNTVMKRTELNKTLNLLCEASGTSQKELDALLPFFKEMPDEEKPMALLDTQIFTKQEKGKHIAVMYRNGEPIKIDIDKDVYDAIRRWTGDDRKWVTLSTIVDTRFGGVINSAFKKLITDYSLIFGLKNFKRDTATALFYTKDLKGYVKNFPKALAVCCLPDSFLSDSMRIYKEAFNAYKENGGIISQFVARDSATPKFFDTANKFNPLKYVEDFNSTLETIPRMAEFISAIDGKATTIAKNGGNYDDAFKSALKNPEDIADAMYRAKDVTLNFDRSGWFGARLNRGLVPFFNPAVQGLDKLGRKMIRDNIKYGADGKVALLKSGDGSFFQDTTVGAFMKFGLALGGMVALPTVAWNELPINAEDGKRYKMEDFINGKVPGYEKQSDYNRYTHYLFPVGDGKFLKIPKARELASIQAPIDFVMDGLKYGSGNKWQKLFGDKAFREWSSMGKIAYEQIGPVSPISDNLLSPIWRTWRNETWYGGKIESGADLDYREQGKRYKIWDEETSAFAKIVGKQFNMSPKKIDNVLDSYTGIIYDFGISQTSAKNDIQGRFTKEGIGSGIKTMLSSPFSQGFIIDSVFRNANKTDYYNYVDKRDKKLEDAKEGSNKWLKLHEEKAQDTNAFAYNSTQYDELISQVYLDDSLTPTEKNYYARQLKKGDNVLWDDRRAGRVTASRDPMADAWNLTDKKGKRVLSTKKIINACSYTFKNGTNTIKDAYKDYKNNGGKSDDKFMKVTLAARDVNRAAGESLSAPRWEVVAYANTLNNIKNGDKVVGAYISDDNKMKRLTENARIYKEYGFTLKNYKTTRKTVVQGAYGLGYDYPADMRDGELTMVLANARTETGKKYRDGAYQANDFWIMQRMNSARCLDHKKNGNIKSLQIKRLCDKYKLNPKKDYSWDIDKVAKAVSKDYGDLSAELQAAMVQVITGCKDYENPFGSVGDYSLATDTGVHCGGYSGYGRGRRGWRRYGYGGGGGSSFSPLINTAGKKSKVSDTSKKNTSKKSNLDDAYRTKLKKLREETRKNNV